MKTGLGEKGRLVSLIAVILMAGFAGTSIFAFLASREAVRISIVENELPVTSDTVYSEIQRDSVRPIFISSMMASDTFLRDWILKGEATPADMIKYLAEVKIKYGAFTSFLVSDRSRRYYQSDTVLKTVEEKEPRDVWYFRVKAMDKPYEVNVDPDMAHADALTVFVNYRVLDYAGNFIGATGVGLNVEALSGLTDEYRQKYGRSVYFVDAAGKIIAGMPGDMEGAAPTNIGVVSGLADISALVLAEEYGSHQYKRGGKNWLLNVRAVPELGWRLFVEKEEDAAISGIRKALRLNLAVCATITLLVLFLTSMTIGRFQSRLEKTASMDGLTGLLNRPALGFLAEQAWKDAKREGSSISLAIVDLDKFKDVNDTFGHQAGDAVLKRSARALLSCVRASDLVCRWGGEEFLVILRSCDLAKARGVAEKMRAAVAAAREGGPAITASFGLAERAPDEGFDGLVRRADEALYAAKRGGRDKIESASPPSG